MNLTNLISMLFPDKTGYTFKSSRHGLVFTSPRHQICRKGMLQGRIQCQYILLQMLSENDSNNDSVDVLNNGFVLSPQISCALSNGERELLGLPGIWPGSFELFTTGQTFQTAKFVPELRLIHPDGHRIRQYVLNGPILEIGEEKYLPSAAQYLALSAVQRHAELPAQERNEGANLAVVYALQKADREGARIELRQFGKISVNPAKHLRISVVEMPDNGLRLIPEFGLGLNPNDIEARLHQMQGSEAVCLRIKDSIVLLDEQKLKGIQEILANRDIPSSERENFLKAPASFLDAYLIDFDNGFSLRVKGSTIFKPAYFGEIDVRRSEWFGGEPDGHIVLLSSMTPLLEQKSNEEFNNFIEMVRQAYNQGKTWISYDDCTVLLPGTEHELEADIEKLRNSHITNPGPNPPP